MQPQEDKPQDSSALCAPSQLERLDHLLLLGLFCVTLLPPLLHYKHFLKLFWFSDDYALLYDLGRLSYGEWLLATFGENITPVFKFVWATLVYSSKGNYVVMTTPLWITHALIVVLFGLLMFRLGFSKLTSCLSCLAIGLSASQSNLLFFSYHLNTGLCTLFAICAGLLVVARNKNWLMAILFGLCLLASIFSFSRGIVVSFAFVLLFLGQSIILPDTRKASAPYLLAALAALCCGLTLLFSREALSNNAGVYFSDVPAMFLFGVRYWSFSPFLGLFGFPQKYCLQSNLLLAFAIFKLLIIVFALATSHKRSQALFVFFLFLLALDFGNTILLGWGRYTEGALAALVPRYQRVALISLCPLLAFFLSEAVRWCNTSKKVSVIACCLLVVGTSFLLLTPWQNKFYHHSRWQGSMGRRVLLEGRLKKSERKREQPWHGIPPMFSYQEARELAKKYDLK